jgi:hypothetical protein
MSVDTTCPFCVVAAGDDNPSVDSKQSDVFYRDAEVVGFISAGWWPNNPGSVLIIPTQHYRSIYDIPPQSYAAVNELGRRVAIIMTTEYPSDNTTKRRVANPWITIICGYFPAIQAIAYTNSIPKGHWCRVRCEFHTRVDWSGASLGRQSATHEFRYGVTRLASSTAARRDSWNRSLTT